MMNSSQPAIAQAPTNAAIATTAATIARTLSNPLDAAATDAGAGRRTGAAPGLAAEAVDVNAGAPARDGGGAIEGAGVAGPDVAAEPTAVGPPGGSVGSLIVGAADGFGGSVMRTVSFFGWTLPVSFFGGNAPPGRLGRFSAINFVR